MFSRRIDSRQVAEPQSIRAADFLCVLASLRDNVFCTFLNQQFGFRQAFEIACSFIARCSVDILTHAKPPRRKVFVGVISLRLN